MIALRLVKLIETHSEELAEGLTQKLLSSERTRDMRNVPANDRFFNKPSTNLLIKRPRAHIPPGLESLPVT